MKTYSTIFICSLLCISFIMTTRVTVETAVKSSAFIDMSDDTPKHNFIQTESKNKVKSLAFARQATPTTTTTTTTGSTSTTATTPTSTTPTSTTTTTPTVKATTSLTSNGFYYYTNVSMVLISTFLFLF